MLARRKSWAVPTEADEIGIIEPESAATTTADSIPGIAVPVEGEEAVLIEENAETVVPMPAQGLVIPAEQEETEVTGDAVPSDGEKQDEIIPEDNTK